MTTCSYTITICDSEYIAMKAALKLMIEHCDTKITDEAGAPFWAHRQSCGKMLDKLNAVTPVIINSRRD